MSGILINKHMKINKVIFSAIAQSWLFSYVQCLRNIKIVSHWSIIWGGDYL